MAPAFAGLGLSLASCATAPVAPDVTTSLPVPVSTVPAGMQYLYGSGEAGALQQTVFHALIAYATEKAAHRSADSVVLAAGSPLVHATFVPCGAKPLAAVFDADETVLLNLGFEADEAAHPGRAYDEARWQRWERTGVGAVAAVPGAVHAFDDLRTLGVTVIVNSNRSTANAASTAAALKAAGLGDFRAGDTLLTRDAGAPSGKDARRAAIAARYCVIAMAGDQLGDFSDLFAMPMPVPVRRQLAVHSSAAGLWGKGWFVLPNPVYGSALRGGPDDVFPADRRWTPAP
ncbi:HAD family acid phosphatase [Sphingomonas sp.]|uniref:HAD family acid phosphatase n=1 Tax=Sphingomonas sp. TaxID=28214 RepID=UPI003AFFF50A